MGAPARRDRAAGRGGAPRADPPARARRRPPGGAGRRRRARRAPALRARDPAVGRDDERWSRTSAAAGSPAPPAPPPWALPPCRPSWPPQSVPRAAGRRWRGSSRGGRTPRPARGASPWSPASPGSARPRWPPSSRGSVHARGGAVLLGRCDEQALVPFQPWIEALERLLDALPPADADHWLTAHDGALARLLPARSAAQEAPGGSRERYLAFELVRALLEDVAAPLAGPARARRRALGGRRLALAAAPRRPVGAGACGCSSCSAPARASSRRRSPRRSPSCDARARSSTSTWPGSTTERSPHCSSGARERPTSRPRVATARAAAAIPSSSASCCARPRWRGVIPTGHPPGCAT